MKRNFLESKDDLEKDSKYLRVPQKWRHIRHREKRNSLYAFVK